MTGYRLGPPDSDSRRQPTPAVALSRLSTSSGLQSAVDATVHNAMGHVLWEMLLEESIKRGDRITCLGGFWLSCQTPGPQPGSDEPDFSGKTSWLRRWSLVEGRTRSGCCGWARRILQVEDQPEAGAAFQGASQTPDATTHGRLVAAQNGQALGQRYLVHIMQAIFPHPHITGMPSLKSCQRPLWRIVFKLTAQRRGTARRPVPGGQGINEMLRLLRNVVKQV